MVHLILDFKPLSDIFQEVGHAIKAGNLWLCQIDVSVPRFLAYEDIVPIELPSQRAFLEATIPREETASSRLSLEEEIDQFRLKEEEKVWADLVEIPNSEGEFDRSSVARSP